MIKHRTLMVHYTDGSLKNMDVTYNHSNEIEEIMECLVFPVMSSNLIILEKLRSNGVKSITKEEQTIYDKWILKDNVVVYFEDDIIRSVKNRELQFV